MPLPSKQNERVLSSQALNVGRSLGVNSNMEKLDLIQMFEETMSVKMFGNLQ